MRIVAFLTARWRAEALAAAPAAFLQELATTEHVRALVDRPDRIGRLRCTEACGARLDDVHGFGGGPDAQWLAAGDAALAFDPLSSQGLYNALYSGMKAGQAIVAALAGDDSALARYAGRLEQIRAHYLARRRAVYESEGRWADAEFWRQRLVWGSRMRQ
jgi:flavin-dependent dehydrogenase